MEKVKMENGKSLIYWILALLFTIIIGFSSGITSYTIAVNEKLSCTRETVSEYKQKITSIEKYIDEMRLDLKDIKKKLYEGD
jgi:uncharacterized membrane protein (DUF106 family)